MSERDTYQEQAEALIADLRARVSHYEALLVAVRDETLTRAAIGIDGLLLRVKGFGEPWDRGYAQGVQDAAYAVRELRVPPAKGCDHCGCYGGHAHPSCRGDSADERTADE